MIHRTRKEALRLLSVALGSMILAAGVTLFLVPNQIASGGTPGMAIVLNAVFPGVTIGTLMLCINIPMVLASLTFIGRGYAIRTVFSILMIAGSADLFLEVLKLTPWSREPILAAIFGGVLIGVGLSLIIKSSASPGGPSIIARMIAQKTHWKEGNLVIILDAVIVVAAGIVFQNVESTLWSLVGVYATSRSLNTLMSGRPSKKVIHIASMEVSRLQKHLLHKLGHDGIIIKGIGMGQGDERKLLMLIVDNNKIQAVRRIVEENDPQSVMVVMEASELMGRGH